MLSYYYKTVFERFLQVFGKIFVQKIRGKNRETPVFIVSAGRSGSTLLRKLLIQTGHFNIPPETGDLITSLTKIYLKNIFLPWKLRAEKIIKHIKNTPEIHVWKIDFDQFAEAVYKLSPSDRNLAELITLLYKNFAIQKGINETDFWGDKTPYLVNRISWIHLIFPHAIIIHIIRDPRAVVLSRIREFNETIDYAIKRWEWSIKSIKKIKRKDRVKEIKYENLVSSTDEIMNDLLSYISGKLKYEKKYSKVHLGDDHYKHHKNLNKPLLKNKIDEWKTLISVKEKQKIENRLSTEMELYGYSI